MFRRTGTRVKDDKDRGQMDMKSKTVVEKVLEELCQCIESVPLETLCRLAGKFERENRIFCDGAGRSRLQAEGFAMRLTQMGFQSSVVGEPTTPALTGGDVLLILSGSGETPMLIEHASKAREIGAGIILVTTRGDSTLGKLSDETVLLKASAKNRKSGDSIQPMGSLFEQSAGILCDIMVLLLMERYQISSEEMYRNHSNLE